MKAVFLSLLVLLSIEDVQPDCALKRDQDGIKVYTCKTEGERLKSLRAEFILENTSFEKLQNFLHDVPYYTKWQYNMIESAMLKKVSDNEMVYRTEVHAPWPVENRELIVKFTSAMDTARQTMDIVIANFESDYPKKENVVRVPSSYATWHIVKQGSDLKVDYA